MEENSEKISTNLDLKKEIINALGKEHLLEPQIDQIDRFVKSINVLSKKTNESNPNYLEEDRGTVQEYIIELINQFIKNKKEVNKIDAIIIILEILTGYIDSLVDVEGINLISLSESVIEYLKMFLKIPDYDSLNIFLSGTAKYRNSNQYEFILSVLRKYMSDDDEDAALAIYLFDPNSFYSKAKVSYRAGSSFTPTMLNRIALDYKDFLENPGNPSAENNETNPYPV